MAVEPLRGGEATQSLGWSYHRPCEHPWWNLDPWQACWAAAGPLAVAFKGAPQHRGREGDLPSPFFPSPRFLLVPPTARWLENLKYMSRRNHPLAIHSKPGASRGSSGRADGASLAQVWGIVRVSYVAKCFPETIYQCTLSQWGMRACVLTLSLVLSI